MDIVILISAVTGIIFLGTLLVRKARFKNNTLTNIDPIFTPKEIHEDSLEKLVSTFPQEVLINKFSNNAYTKIGTLIVEKGHDALPMTVVDNIAKQTFEKTSKIKASKEEYRDYTTESNDIFSNTVTAVEVIADIVDIFSSSNDATTSDSSDFSGGGGGSGGGGSSDSW